MLKLMLFLTLSSCEGRCSATTAVRDEVGIALCAVGSHRATCTKGNKLIQCDIEGLFFQTAYCRVVGHVTP